VPLRNTESERRYADFGSRKRMNLNRNFATVPSVAPTNIGNNCHADNEMDNAKDEAKKFRDYAAECRRLAQRASEKDRAVLMEIAAAWISCAEEAERKAKVRPK
jgi:hypothetical protein